jgi:hypothetical protein
LLLASVLPAAQRIVLGGLDFTFLRLLVIAGFARVLARSETDGFRWTALDKSFVALVAVTTITYALRLRSGTALVFQLGVAFDALGLYFLTRFLVRGWQDLDRLALSAILVSIPTAAFFLIEFQTGRNLFSVFGGVAEITTLREGKLRCTGAFGNAILAGCFWASLAPLMVARAFQPHASRMLSVVGTTCVLIIVVACSSSTPLMGLFVGIVGVCFLPIRSRLRWVRWGILGLLTSLHIVMKAPVWHLISRIDLVGGSTGYHRYNLIDKFIRNFSEWWLLGTNSTAHWGWGLHDTANQYVATGVRGGLLSLILFIAVLSLAFRQNGEIVRRAGANKPRLAYSWAMGVTLLMHTIMFLAVSYWGQITVIWYAGIASIASLTPLPTRHTLAAPETPRPPLAHTPTERQVRPPSPQGGLADGLLRRP